jgi:hypothetical protein
VVSGLPSVVFGGDGDHRGGDQTDRDYSAYGNQGELHDGPSRPPETPSGDLPTG